VSQAANDLNFTFVVDEIQGDRLVEQLHEMLIRPVPGDRVLGPTWDELFSKPTAADVARATPWWRTKRDQLLGLLKDKHSAYVYDIGSVTAAARALRAIKSVSRVHYAMKANPHPDILRALTAEGIHPECVSRGEVERVLETLPGIDRSNILFTPNFAPRDEYVWGYEQGVKVTVDNSFVLEKWPDVFKGREVFVRVDTGTGRGHHHHVRTAGTHSKFGVPLAELPGLAKLASKAGAKVVGLHAHTGSGVFDVRNWEETATLLTGLIEQFPDVRVVDIGGGLGVPERADQPGIDLAKLDESLAKVKAAFPKIELWMEPGRYFVAAAGVLVARVTQLKSKGGARYVGVATGMNSLIRPALYGAYHEIVNLSRLDEAGTELADIVGPICESADILGHDRLLPPTQEGDVLLVANAGAYGRAMSSSYNLRDPAVEICI
jgi:diaminopimelate decarboxylase/aspartate kinase